MAQAAGTNHISLVVLLSSVEEHKRTACRLLHAGKIARVRLVQDALNPAGIIAQPVTPDAFRAVRLP